MRGREHGGEFQLAARDSWYLGHTRNPVAAHTAQLHSHLGEQVDVEVNDGGSCVSLEAHLVSVSSDALDLRIGTRQVRYRFNDGGYGIRSVTSGSQTLYENLRVPYDSSAARIITPAELSGQGLKRAS